MAESLRRTSAGLVPSERNDLYWEKLKTRDGLRYQVAIRYAIPKANFEKLVESYAVAETAMGAKAVSYFPSLAWRWDVTEGAVVVKVANDSTLRYAGIQEGDLVLSGMDRVVHDARSWKRVLDEESAALAHNRRRAAAQGQARRRAGHRHAAAHRRGRPGLGRPDLQAAPDARRIVSHQTGKTTKNQTGNIWDDNPEE